MWEEERETGEWVQGRGERSKPKEAEIPGAPAVVDRHGQL